MAFDPGIYERIREGCKSSAAQVVPLLRSFLGYPSSVADVGGGEGWWAVAFLDFDAWRVALIETPISDRPVPVPAGIDFYAHDLMLPLPAEAVAEAGGRYDLALCLEVAEHLPEDAADVLVDTLCQLAPAVAFSAAIPGQTGHGHLNCQWPAYWADRFGSRGYTVSGCLRRIVWNDERIEPWYRQNLLIAVDDEGMGRVEDPGLFFLDAPPAALVHPDIYAWQLDEVARLRSSIGRV